MISDNLDMVRKAPKPDIYGYTEYRPFLRDWIEYKRQTVRGFTVKEGLKKTGLPLCTISTVLSGKMSLSDDVLAAMGPELRLSRSQIRVLRNMRDVEEASDQEIRVKALKKLQNHRIKQGVDGGESEASKFLSTWHQVAIRELALLPGFRPDPEWIQSQLVEHVPLNEIKTALQFLIKSEYIDISGPRTRKASKQLSFEGGFFRLALAEYAKQFLELGKKAFGSVPREERDLKGYTGSFTEEEFQEIKRSFDETLERILEKKSKNRKRSKSEKDNRRVYHLSLGAIPITKKRAG